MSFFPRQEAVLIALASKMVAGFNGNPAVYPAPPVTPVDLDAKLAAFVAARSAFTTAEAAMGMAMKAKNAARDDLAAAMRRDLRYAEMTVGINNGPQLQRLGWGGRSTKTKLQPPGQVRALEAPRQGEGSVFLDWKEPIDGGKVAAYVVQRRERPSGNWTDVATAMESQITLTEQPRASELEYRVVAVNKAGTGAAGNTVMVVL